MKLLVVALAITYPVLAHAAVTNRSPVIMAAALAVLATLVLLPRMLKLSVAAWIASPFVVAALIWLVRVDAAWLPFFAMPVLINLFAAWVFGHTLAAGHVPLIERFARAMHAPDGISPEIARYARNITLAWTVFLLGLAFTNLALALLAGPEGILLRAGWNPPVTVPVEIWSLFANVLGYLLVGAFFLAEYVYRRHRFPAQPYRNLLDFMMRMRRIGPELLTPKPPAGAP